MNTGKPGKAGQSLQINRPSRQWGVMRVIDRYPLVVQALLDDSEFVPLALAASMAYFEVAEAKNLIGSEAELSETARVIAIALSRFTPVYYIAEPRGPVVLSEASLHYLLTAARPVELDCLGIRPADLQRAIEALKGSATAVQIKARIGCVRS